MDAHRLARRAGAVAATAALALVTASAVAAADTAVTIADFEYDPDPVTVAVGDTVTWTNNDSAPHTATADDASFDTGSLAQGASGDLTFDTAGSFAYHCAIHPDMTGTVVVEAAAGGGGGATTPPTDTLDPESPNGTATLGALGVTLLALAIAAGIGYRRATRRG